MFLIFHHSKILFRISLYPPSALRAPSPQAGEGKLSLFILEPLILAPPIYGGAADG